MVSNMLFGDTMKGQLSPSQKRIWAPPGSTECGFPLGDERSPGPHFSVTTSDKSAFLAAGAPRPSFRQHSPPYLCPFLSPETSLLLPSLSSYFCPILPREWTSGGCCITPLGL